MHNIHVFQQCSGSSGQSPYLINAKVCGDKLGRPFNYPPFLFAFFRWVRPLSLDATMRIWTTFLIAAFAGIFYVWNRKIVRAPPQGARHETVAFCVLLLLQYPFVFALERGNTDTINVLFYTLPRSCSCAGGSGWRGWRPGWRRVSSCRPSSRSRR